MRKIPKPLERDFPHTWKAQTPRFPRIPIARLLLLSRSETIKASSRATHYILDLPTDSSYEAFYFVVFRMWGAGVINESILSKAVASALGNLG